MRRLPTWPQAKSRWHACPKHVVCRHRMFPGGTLLATSCDTLFLDRANRWHHLQTLAGCLWAHGRLAGGQVWRWHDVFKTDAVHHRILDGDREPTVLPTISLKQTGLFVAFALTVPFNPGCPGTLLRRTRCSDVARHCDRDHCSQKVWHSTTVPAMPANPSGRSSARPKQHSFPAPDLSCPPLS